MFINQLFINHLFINQLFMNQLIINHIDCRGSTEWDFESAGGYIQIMIYTDLTTRAMSICFQAHKEQRDKGGMPYVFHPFHLAEQMSTEEEICTALLHDVIEDTAWTLERLAAQGFPGPVLDALALMTHKDGTPYLEYVRKLSVNPVAARVKLADLRHNSTAARLKTITQKDTQRLRKYLKAQAILTGGEADLEEMCLRLKYELEAEGGETMILRAVFEPDGRIRQYELSSEGCSGKQSDDCEELVLYDKISLLSELMKKNLELPESL